HLLAMLRRQPPELGDQDFVWLGDVLEEHGQRDLLAALGEDLDGLDDHGDARLRLRRLAVVQHRAERLRGAARDVLKLRMTQLAGAVRHDGQRERAAVAPAWRVEAHGDRLPEPPAARLERRLIARRREHGLLRIRREVALAVDQHRGNAAEQELLYDVERRGRFAASRAAEKGRVTSARVAIE